MHSSLLCLNSLVSWSSRTLICNGWFRNSLGDTEMMYVAICILLSVDALHCTNGSSAVWSLTSALNNRPDCLNGLPWWFLHIFPNHVLLSLLHVQKTSKDNNVLTRISFCELLHFGRPTVTCFGAVPSSYVIQDAILNLKFTIYFQRILAASS
jgi:hypothetical protein